MNPLPPPPAPASSAAPAVRPRGSFWTSLGGDGLMVSVAVHGLLAVFAISWVVSSYSTRAPVREPDQTFEPGKKGGPRASTEGIRMKPKSMPGKTVAKITVAKPDAAVALPATPQSGPTFANALPASGGLAGGPGGKGAGPGGPGNGGRHYAGYFGYNSLGAPGLPGTFYDCKQLPSGEASAYADDAANAPYVDKVLRAFVKGWDESVLTKFYRAPDRLVADRLFIPRGPADAAPAAYGVGDKCKGRRWVAHYKGLVTAPKSGKFRFVVLGDDALAVRFNGKTVADGGFTVLGFPGHLSNYAAKPDPKRGLPPGITEDTYKGVQAPPFRCGNWIEVVKGREYPMEVVLSEIPGGLFSAYLLMEEADPMKPGRGDGALFLFRMGGEDLPEGFAQDTGLAVDLTGKNLIWRTRTAPKRVH